MAARYVQILCGEHRGGHRSRLLLHEGRACSPNHRRSNGVKQTARPCPPSPISTSRPSCCENEVARPVRRGHRAASPSTSAACFYAARAEGPHDRRRARSRRRRARRRRRSPRPRPPRSALRRPRRPYGEPTRRLQAERGDRRPSVVGLDPEKAARTCVRPWRRKAKKAAAAAPVPRWPPRKRRSRPR